MSTKSKKLITAGRAAKISAQARKRGLKVVTENGCFDLIHVGHTRNLAHAKSLGDILVVGINSDASVRKLKGKNRPIVPAKERAEVLASLAYVDYVFIYNSTSPILWLRKIKPGIHVKGAGATAHPAFIPEKNAVEAGGGRIVLAPYIADHSTTDLEKRIVKRFKKI
ncbi:MAG: adenylyltransferase/cytidyltransferase family protein [Candidatus Liptonbacteria bacterium]|nr:adenylyltransferase/cytidyltransferase family protein [Candidatus Liptonbacteria bacterium]